MQKVVIHVKQNSEIMNQIN